MFVSFDFKCFEVIKCVVLTVYRLDVVVRIIFLRVHVVSDFIDCVVEFV